MAGQARATAHEAKSPFDRPAIEAWLAARIGALAPPVAWRQLTGGHSNFTFQLNDAAGRSLVVRRPPLGELLPKAHDMAREWRILVALSGSDVPVPSPLAFCDDTSITGAPFYAMEAVAGEPLLDAADFDARVALDAREALAFSMIDTLAALHNLRPKTVGLADLGAPDDYLSRQIRSWRRAWVASSEITGTNDLRFDLVHERLEMLRPVQQQICIVHGDFGFHNCLIAVEPKILSVIDWEICTLGDPLADLGYLLARWPGDPLAASLASNDVSGVAGFPSQAQVAARYGAATGADLAQLDYYIAFNYWKTAAIVTGVHARYVSGQKTRPEGSLAEFPRLVDHSLGMACRFLDRVSATPSR